MGIGAGVGVTGMIAVALLLSGNRAGAVTPVSGAIPAVAVPNDDTVVVTTPVPKPAAGEPSSPAISAEPLTVVESPATTPVPTVAMATAASREASPAEPIANAEAAVAVSSSAAGEESAKPYDLPDLIALVEPSVVRINVMTTHGPGQGSGFVVDDRGTIVTNHHVMAGAVRAEVEFVDGTKTPVVGFRWFHDRKDIAIIDIDLPPEKLRPIKVADKLPTKGVKVMAFGAPQGLSFTSSDGIVSALRDPEEAKETLAVEGHWVQTTAPISPGNSGGPLVDLYGRVVGMNTFCIEGQSLNFAVSCLDIAEAMATAPSTVKPLKADAIPDRVSESVTREAAVDEVGTERGQKLLAQVKTVAVLNGLRTTSFDPTGAIWDRVIQRSKLAVEKSGMSLSFGEPAADAALLIVILELRPTSKGTGGTQELHIKSELLVLDPFAKRLQAVSRVWQAEAVVGTISLEAAAQGVISRNVDANLTKFFQSFRMAYQKAQRDVAANADSKP